MYMIAAEVTEDQDEAAGYLNTLRGHRGLREIPSSTQVERYLEAEWLKELYGEGQLFFYYKRKAMETIGAENNIAHQDVNAVYNLPIPTVEIDFGNIKN